ncbi:MAG TPA: DNA mismatch endonuclease Vsr [Bryobacteraceae bacterium]|jgi:DNA mismatch endonuclease (patch repair protein)|nr:DNA mismatch endonuclease Vsr [Bryobacteraceae bacterium]
MTDVLTPAQRSYNMSRIRGVHTVPELRVRRLLHGMGLRYRLHGKGLPGKPDLVFARSRAVLFVHGCFWHMHRCKRGKPVPATNKDFWAVKRQSNVDRDKRNRKALKADGWHVFEIWECQTRDEAGMLAKLDPLIRFLRANY